MSGIFLVALQGSSADAVPPVESKNCGSRFLRHPNAQYFIVITCPSLNVAPRENVSSALATGRHLRMDSTQSPQSSTPPSGDAAVITVDTVSGQLLHVGVPELDLFASVDDALRAIPALCATGTVPPSVQIVNKFVALAGACLTDDAIHILFVEKHKALASLCEVPVYAAVQAQWYSIPLRVAVSALQPAGWKSLASGVATLPSLVGWVGEKMCLYYSPGVDVTHCDAFTTAVRRAASAPLRGAVRTEGDGYHEGSTYCTGDRVLQWGILPTMPAQTGRDALGRCDCLWNEDLIAFCDVYGLGGWCCRLALGSCTTTSREVHGSQAILLVRLSRLAVPGCMGDDYVSPMETEFQLMLIGQNSIDNTKKKKREMPNDQKKDISDDREGDISDEREGDISDEREGDISDEREGDISDEREGDISDHREGDISDEREGDISDEREGDISDDREEDISDDREEDISDDREGDISDDRAGDISDEREGDISDEREGDISDEREGDISDEREGDISIEREGDISDHREGDISDEREGDISIEREGDISIEREGDISDEREGDISDDQAVCVSSGLESSGLGGASASESRVFSLVWRRGSDFTGHPDLAAQRLRFDNYALRFVDPMPPWEDHVAGVFAGYLERYGPGTRIALVHSCAADRSAEEALCALAAHVRAHALRPPVTVGSALHSRSAPLVPPRRAPAVAERCVMRVCVGDAMTKTTPEAMAAWLRTVLHVSAPVEEAARILLTASASLTCDICPAELLAFTAALFPRGAHFVPRAAARHRTALLSHPARLAAVVDAQLFAPATRGSADTQRFPFSPTQPLRHSSSPHDKHASASAFECEGDLGACLRPAVHPAAPAVRIPPTATSVELTIALPALAHVTHIALSVAGAVQEAPYAAPLSLSLTACCYLGQAPKRVVLEDVPLPLALNGTAACAEPRLIFFALPRFCKNHGNTSHDGPFDTIEYADASLGLCGMGFDDTAPVFARFMHIELRGSGAHAMAVSPVFVFGEVLDDISPGARDAVFGRHTALRRNLHTSESQWHSVSTTNNAILTAPRQQSREACNEMYMHKISELFPTRLYYVSIELALVMEAKRRQCGARRCDREVCLRRVGAPRWLLNPALHLLPHSAFHRSQLPGDYATAKTATKAKGTTHTTKEKRCALCGHDFSWRYKSSECDRCKCSVCDKCTVSGRVCLVELGYRESYATLCPPCHAQAIHVDAAHEAFLLSYGKDGEGVAKVAPSEAVAKQKEEEEEAEEAASIDFYTRYAVPRLAETLRGFPLGRTYTHGPCTLLTAHPHTRVVSAPGMHDPEAPLFENALPLLGHMVGPNAHWRAVAPEEWTESATCLQRRVVLLLPHDAQLHRGILRFAVEPCGDVAVDIQLHAGATLQGLRMRARGCVSCGTREAEEIALDCAFDEAEEPVRLIALIFSGTAADLARLCVASFTAWGAFAPLPECRRTALKEYVAKLSAMRYAMRHVSGSHSSAHASLSSGCLPRMLFMTRLIPPRAITTHSSRTGRFAFLVEFDFGVPVTVCGFTLEQHHPAFAAASHNAIATALRFIGVSAAGCRGNMSYVQLPWPPLTDAEKGAPEAMAFSYALPLPNLNIVSVMVEVVEWRLAGPPGGEEGSEGEGVGRRSIYLGKMQFWTSVNAVTRHVVSSGSFASIHTSAE